MIYIAAILIALLLVLRRFTPKVYAVHASRAVPLPPGVKPQTHYLLSGLVRDAHGKHMDLSGKFIGRATRDSMVVHGIQAGEMFVADYLDDGGRHKLKPGDIVVVDGAAEYSETGLRLRVIAGVSPDGAVQFKEDSVGRTPRNRPLEEVTARVTHVIGRPTQPSLIDKLFHSGSRKASSAA